MTTSMIGNVVGTAQRKVDLDRRRRMHKFVALALGVVVSTIMAGPGCMSEASSPEEILVTLSVDGRIVFSRADLIDGAERDAFYATKERDIAVYSASLQGDQSETVRIEIEVSGKEHASRWSFDAPARDSNSALLKLTAALDSDLADAVEDDAPIRPLGVTSTTDAKQYGCCVTCGDTTACGCAVEMSCGSCCSDSCC